MRENVAAHQRESSKASEGSFRWLNRTQFLGALNDNIFKLLMVLFLIGSQGMEEAGRVAATAGAVFVVPFLLFSPLAGRLADRFSKRSVIVAAKYAEVGIMTLGVFCFLRQSPFGLYLTLGLMSTQSALFSPAKYGIVPELLPQEDLSRGNARLEALTYLAIVLGTALAPLLPRLAAQNFAIAALACVGVALLGLASSLPIRRTSPGGGRRPSSLWVIPDLLRTLSLIRQDGDLLLAVLGSAWFTLLGAFFQLNLLPYGLETLHLTESRSSSLFLVAALGIGLGSLIAGRVSKRGVEFGIVPLGALGLTLSSFLLGAFDGALGLAIGAILLLGLSAGLIIVPLQAFIQLRAPRDRRGEVLAAANFLNWVGVLLASALLYLLNGPLGLSARQGFGVITLLILALALVAFRVLPDFFLRFLVVVLTRLFYRIRVHDLQNLPAEKGALLVANHVSWVDALILLTTGERRIRFIMERGIYNTTLLRPLCRLMGVIPISSKDSRELIADSLGQARQALDEGFLVCIFAEGMVTRNGQLAPFKTGMETIVRGSGHPIIPIHLGGLWGSIFSYAHGRLLGRLPQRIPYPVSVRFGSPLPADTPAAKVRQAVLELSSGEPSTGPESAFA